MNTNTQVSKISTVEQAIALLHQCLDLSLIGNAVEYLKQRELRYQLLFLYSHFFPQQYAKSNASVYPCLEENDGLLRYTEREIEFLQLVDKNLFPLNYLDYLLEEETYFVEPCSILVTPLGMGQLEDYDMSYCDLALGDKILLPMTSIGRENLDAELLFIDRHYIFHYLEGDRHVYKSLTSDVLRSAFKNEPTDTGWLPKSVIRHGSCISGNWVVCFFSQQRYKLQINEEQLHLPLPSFVLMGIGSSYFLWSVKKNQFEPSLILYHAPLPNVMTDGRICWGNVFPPLVSFSNIESTWFKFISSTFNQDYTQGKSRKYNNIVERLQLLNQKVKVSSRCRYPISDLVPVRDRLSVEQAVEAVIKNVEYKQ